MTRRPIVYTGRLRDHFISIDRIMFGQVPKTPYDLHFHVLGIPVRIHPAFFVLSAIIGFSPRWAAQLHLNQMVIIGLCTLVIFVSILVHELGHALLARHYGWPPHIVLYHMGGLAIFNPGYGHTSTRSILISLAGPGAGFVLYGLTKGVEYVLIQQHVELSAALFYILVQMKFVNLWWGVLNLLPVYPLDGGQVAEQICRKIDPYRGMEYTFKLGIITAIGAAIAFYFYRRPEIMEDSRAAFPCLLFLFLAFNNYQMMQQYSGRGGPW